MSVGAAALSYSTVVTSRARKAGFAKWGCGRWERDGDTAREGASEKGSEVVVSCRTLDEAHAPCETAPRGYLSRGLQTILKITQTNKQNRITEKK